MKRNIIIIICAVISLHLFPSYERCANYRIMSPDEHAVFGKYYALTSGRSIYLSTNHTIRISNTNIGEWYVVGDTLMIVESYVDTIYDELQALLPAESKNSPLFQKLHRELTWWNNHNYPYPLRNSIFKICGNGKVIRALYDSEQTYGYEVPRLYLTLGESLYMYKPRYCWETKIMSVPQGCFKVLEAIEEDKDVILVQQDSLIFRVLRPKSMNITNRGPYKSLNKVDSIAQDTICGIKLFPIQPGVLVPGHADLMVVDVMLSEVRGIFTMLPIEE